MRRRRKVISFLLANALLISNVSSSLQLTYAEDMTEISTMGVESFTNGEENFGGVEDYETGTHIDVDSTQPATTQSTQEEPTTVSQKVEEIQQNDQGNSEDKSQEVTSEAEEVPTLSSTSFDVSKGSVSIWDDTDNTGKVAIEYSGATYPNIDAT